MDVIRSPTHPANAVEFILRAKPSGMVCIMFDNMIKRNELPRITSPEEKSDIGTISEVAIPMAVTGIAMINPAKGPDIPTSNNAFLFGMGSLLEINAPNVPMLNPGKIGGMGIKNGRDVLIPCFFEVK